MTTRERKGAMLVSVISGLAQTMRELRDMPGTRPDQLDVQIQLNRESLQAELDKITETSVAAELAFLDQRNGSWINEDSV